MKTVTKTKLSDLLGHPAGASKIGNTEKEKKDDVPIYDFKNQSKSKYQKAHDRTSSLETMAEQIIQTIQKELQYSGLDKVEPPCLERLRIFQSAFDRIVELLPSYKPLLDAIRYEYDSLVDYLITANNATETLAARLKLMKMESAKFVTDANYHFQTSVEQLKNEALQYQEKCKKMEAETSEQNVKYERLQLAAATAEKHAEDMHRQNHDIVRNFQRKQLQLEEGRKKEMYVQAEINGLKQSLKAAEDHIQTVERELQQESTKNVSMVPMEEHQSLQEKVSAYEQELKELRKGAMKMNDENEKLLKRVTAVGASRRPLTPRPDFDTIEGLADSYAYFGPRPEPVGTVDKVQYLHQIAEKLYLNSRTVLGTYGYVSACKNSELTKKEYEDIEKYEVEEKLFNGMDNLKFSRHTAYEIMNRFLEARIADQNATNQVIDALAEYCRVQYDNEAIFPSLQDAINHYAPEPDYLAFQLMLDGRISEFIVNENINLTTELKQKFHSHEETDGAVATKQAFFYALQTLIPLKNKRMWQEVQHYLPAGSGETLINIENLLEDNLYVPSPIVFGLRVQHLEENVLILKKIETLVKELGGTSGTINFVDTMAKFTSTRSLSNIDEEAILRGFNHDKTKVISVESFLFHFQRGDFIDTKSKKEKNVEKPTTVTRPVSPEGDIQKGDEEVED